MSSERFYSRVLLRVVSPSGDQRGASKEYLIHQLVADLFPDQDERGYLYRVLEDRPGGAQVLVLSSESPRSSADRPVRDWGCALDVQSKPFAPQLSKGQALDFEVRLNATTSVDGRRTDVWDAVFAADREDPRSPADPYKEFLARRLNGAAEVLSTHVTERRFVSLRRKLGRQRPITFVSANVVRRLVEDRAGLLGLVVDGAWPREELRHGLLCFSRPGSVLASRRSP